MLNSSGILQSVQTVQTFPQVQQPSFDGGDDQFLTFDNPFLTAQCQDASAPGATCDWDESRSIERLHQLLKGGSMAISRQEIESIISRACRSCPEDMHLALAELCLEINMLSGATGDFGNRITVWFDSYSQRLYVKTANGNTDCISIAHLLSEKTD